MKDFKKQIGCLAASRRNKTANVVQAVNEVSPAFANLLEITKDAADILNDRSASNIIDIYTLEREVVSLLFGFNSTADGFIIATDIKYVFIVTNNTGIIYTYGLEKQKSKKGGSLLSASLQLLTINYNETPEGMEFRDNTGTAIDPEEIVFQLVKWSTN